MKHAIDDYQKEDNLKKRLYLLAKRKGLALQLCRKSEGPDCGTFRILNRTSRAVVHSARPGGYGLTLDQVEEYLAHHPAKEQVSTGQILLRRPPAADTGTFLKAMNPKHEGIVSHNAIPTAPDPSQRPRDPRTMTLGEKNVALLEAVANNLQKAIERDTSQLALVRSMIAKAKSAQ